MGPVMNLLLAFVVMAVVLYQGAEVPAFDQQPVVVGSFSKDSVAKAAGVHEGDRIVAVDGRAVETWEKFQITIVAKAKREVTLGIDRGGTATQVRVVPTAQGKFEMGDIGILPPMHPQIIAVEKGEPAAGAGLQAGDVVLAAGGERDITHERLIDVIKAHRDQPLTIEIRRAGAVRHITVVPRLAGDVVRIGVSLSSWELRSVRPGALEAVQMSLRRNWEWATMIVQTLAGLLTRDTSVKQLMGPVAIAQVSGSAAEAGWLQLFGLMAMISLNLGLLNLMPVPVLEGLSRRDFSMKVKEKMLMVGFVLLVMLMVTVIYNDLTRVQWVERLMPWR
jgi:regulator of sigma E protease